MVQQPSKIVACQSSFLGDFTPSSRLITALDARDHNSEGLCPMLVEWLFLAAASATFFVPFHPSYFQRSPFCAANPDSEPCLAGADHTYIDCTCEGGPPQRKAAAQCPPEMLLGSCWRGNSKHCLSTFSQLSEDIQFSNGKQACSPSISKCQLDANCSTLMASRNRSAIFLPSDTHTGLPYREMLQCLAQHVEICPCAWESCETSRPWTFYVYAIGFPVLWGVCVICCVIACFMCLCERRAHASEAVPATWDCMAKPCHPESFVEVACKQLSPKRRCSRCRKLLIKGVVIHCEACQSDLCRACLFFFGVRGDLLVQAEAVTLIGRDDELELTHETRENTHEREHTQELNIHV